MLSRTLLSPNSLRSLRVAPSRVHSVRAMAAAAKTVLVPVGNGTEEMEAVVIIDVLRRAGAEVTVASVESDLTVKCSRGVMLVADKPISEAASASYDMVALPGGMPGAERLRDSKALTDILRRQGAGTGVVAAMCASPAVVLEAHGLLGGKAATAHPAFTDKLSNKAKVDDRVVWDGNVATSRGPGTAFEFALSLVKHLYGEAKMREVAGPMVMQPGYDKFV